MKNKVICIVGPTASGKTGLSIELAKRINGEIISADSMQIYKQVDIGTAKPTDEEKQGIKHYMLDFIDIEKNKKILFSVADFKKKAESYIEDILNRKRQPIIVGGTGLYIEALIKNIQFNEEVSKKQLEYRNKLNDILMQEDGKEKLYSMLEDIDPTSAKKIHKNNVKRVIRALEICNNTGITKTENDVISLEEKAKYNYEIFVIDLPRDILYNRINSRVDKMIENNLIDEAKYIKQLNLDKTSTVMQAIGYKELFDYIDGKEDIKTAIDKLKQATRNYAKRQITWFKRYKTLIYLNGTDTEENMIKKIKECIYSE